jgi:UDP-glucose 6-dehydrogenase
MQAAGKSLVIGLGEVGGALAAVLEAACGPILRQDLAPLMIDEPIGVMHICIPYRDGGEFAAAVAAYARRFNPALIIINSTVLPGITRALAAATGVPTVYSPVRGKHVKMAADLRHYTKYVAGVAPAASAQAQEHFIAAGIPSKTMDRPETLELAKLAETTYFGLQIAFAQELNRYAERVGADYAQAIDFFEEVAFLPRTRYFPGVIGGHCVMPNIDLLRGLATAPLLDAIVDSNRRRERELALDHADGAGPDAPTATIQPTPAD